MRRTIYRVNFTGHRLGTHTIWKLIRWRQSIDKTHITCKRMKMKCWLKVSTCWKLIPNANTYRSSAGYELVNWTVDIKIASAKVRQCNHDLAFLRTNKAMQYTQFWSQCDTYLQHVFFCIWRVTHSALVQRGMELWHTVYKYWSEH